MYTVRFTKKLYRLLWTTLTSMIAYLIRIRVRRDITAVLRHFAYILFLYRLKRALYHKNGCASYASL